MFVVSNENKKQDDEREKPAYIQHRPYSYGSETERHPPEPVERNRDILSSNQVNNSELQNLGPADIDEPHI